MNGGNFDIDSIDLTVVALVDGVGKTLGGGVGDGGGEGGVLDVGAVLGDGGGSGV